MKNIYISIIVLSIIAVGASLILGNSKKAQAPVGEKSNVSVGVVTGAVKEFTVTGENFSFIPSVMTVKKGDKVKINFKNQNGMHNLIIDEFAVNTGIIKSGEEKSVEFTADKTGSFQYYCSVGSHRAMGMWGTLKVE